MRRKLTADELKDEAEDQSGNRELTAEEQKLVGIGRSQERRYDHPPPLENRVREYCRATKKDFHLVLAAVTRGNSHQMDGDCRTGQIAQAYYEWAAKNL